MKHTAVHVITILRLDIDSILQYSEHWQYVTTITVI